MALPIHKAAPATSVPPLPPERRSRAHSNNRNATAARYPSGRVKPEARTDTRNFTLYQRVRQAGLDPRSATALGMLLYQEVINESEYDTGEQIGEIYRRYERLEAEGRRNPKSPNYNRSFGPGISVYDSGDAQLIEEHEERVAKAKDEWNLLQKTFPTRHVRGMIEQLCVDNEAIPYRHYDDLKKVLNLVGEALAKHRKKAK